MSEKEERISALRSKLEGFVRLLNVNRSNLVTGDNEEKIAGIERTVDLLGAMIEEVSVGKSNVSGRGLIKK